MKSKYTKEQLEDAKIKLEYFYSYLDLTPEEFLQEQEETQAREIDLLDSAYNFTKEKKW